MKLFGKGTMETISNVELHGYLKKAKEIGFITMLVMLYVVHLQQL